MAKRSRTLDKLSEFDKDIVTRDIRRPPSRARLVGLFGPAAGQVFSLKGEETTLGRSPSANIPIDSQEVSRSHCRIWRGEGDRWFVEDQSSSNGTYINGMRLKEALEIHFGDRLQLARDALFVFTHHDMLEDQVIQLQKMDALGHLAGEVAHDFKNLLTVFSATVEMWQMRHTRGQLRTEAPFTEQQLEQDLSRMEEASARANDLIQRLLGYARPSQDQVSAVDVSEVTREALRLCEDTFPKGITVETSINPFAMVPGDATQLHQAVMNLLVNARDALPYGGQIQISVEELRQGQIKGLDAPFTPRRFVCVSVTDTGLGMDQSTRERIFDPFFTTKEKGKGTGLGLATVNAIAARHDGQVLVESTPGQGATFRIILPTVRQELSPPAREIEVTEEISLPDFKDTQVISRPDMVIATSAKRWEDDLTEPSIEEDPES